jgi:xanthine dehydrogenase accessory factor
MTDAFLEAARRLAAGQGVALARIIRQSGSAPRSVGTRCLVSQDGTLVGTIGGGLLEHQVMLAAGEAMKEARSRIVHFRLAGEDVAKTDMLCGGLVDVYVEPLSPEQPEVVALFRRLEDLIRSGGSGVLLTRVAQGVGADDASSRFLWIGQEPLPAGALGTLAVPHGEIPRLLRAAAPTLEASGDPGVHLFVEPVRAQDVLLLFGAGHISTFVAPLAAMVGFRVVVVDDREEFANRGRFPHADEILVAPVAEAFARLSVTASSYIAIITRGHAHDHAALRAALGREAAYIGMIGSQRKRAVVYKALRDEGITREQLDGVHSPIGLDIGAETPEEIAVSIVAELIQVRAARRGGVRP